MKREEESEERSADYQDARTVGTGKWCGKDEARQTIAGEELLLTSRLCVSEVPLPLSLSCSAELADVHWVSAWPYRTFSCSGIDQKDIACEAPIGDKSSLRPDLSYCDVKVRSCFEDIDQCSKGSSFMRAMVRNSPAVLSQCAA